MIQKMKIENVDDYDYYYNDQGCYAVPKGKHKGYFMYDKDTISSKPDLCGEDWGGCKYEDIPKLLKDIFRLS